MHEGLFYQLINEEGIDGLANSFYLTMDRVARMDYTFLTWGDGFSLVVPRPGEENRLFAFVGPFQPTVWLLIFISIFVVVSVMTLFTWIYQWNVKHSSSSAIFDTESDNQPKENEEVSKISHQRSLFTSFGSHVIYVMNIMTNQGIVISSLTKPRMKPTINSFEDLAASKEVSIVLRHDTVMGEQILKATSGIYKILGDQARRNPDRIVGDPLKLNAMLETGRYAYPFLSTFGYSFVGSQYKKEGKCRFKTSKTLSASTGYYSFLFKKGSSHTPAMSRALMDMFEFGLLRHWVYNLPTIPRAEKCFADSKSEVSREVPIQLTDLTSAFLILGIGTGLGMLTFCVEFRFLSSSIINKLVGNANLIVKHNYFPDFFEHFRSNMRQSVTNNLNDCIAKQSILTESQPKISLVVRPEECGQEEEVYCICCSSDGPTTMLVKTTSAVLLNLSNFLPLERG
ncbi:hypothetical protein OUZ56_024762 [Daphnia magna]|nr:hypothetical protein OUZ56_024762 [Daphnia magna]